ncbi:hypothetical protein ACVW04_002334 [Bradyrhizobium sp. LM2.3]
MRSADDDAEREHAAGNDREHHGVKQRGLGIVASAGTDRARNRGGNAATEAAIRRHGHQHEDRKHQRGAGERIGAEEADIIGFRDVDRGLRHQDRDGRQGEFEQRRQDRRHQQRGTLLLGGAFCYRGALCCRGAWDGRERPAERSRGAGHGLRG